MIWYFQINQSLCLSEGFDGNGILIPIDRSTRMVLECVVVAKQTAKPAFLCSVTPIIACERFRWTFAAPFLVNSRSGELFRWNERTKRGVVISSIFVGCYHPIFRSRYIHGPRGGNRRGASPWFVRITWWHECEWLPWSNCNKRAWIHVGQMTKACFVLCYLCYLYLLKTLYLYFYPNRAIVVVGWPMTAFI